jgi:hypothetical protein
MGKFNKFANNDEAAQIVAIIIGIIILINFNLI